MSAKPILRWAWFTVAEFGAVLWCAALVSSLSLVLTRNDVPSPDPSTIPPPATSSRD